MRRWRRHRMGTSTLGKECPDCGSVIIITSGGRLDVDPMHLHTARETEYDELRSMVLALWGERPAPAEPEPAPEPVELAEDPWAPHEPTWEERMPRYESLASRWAAAIVRADKAISRAFADAWLAAFPRRTAPAELPPATIPAAPAIPVPDYVADHARRQVQRAEQRRQA